MMMKLKTIQEMQQKPHKVAPNDAPMPASILHPSSASSKSNNSDMSNLTPASGIQLSIVSDLSTSHHVRAAKEENHLVQRKKSTGACGKKVNTDCNYYYF